MITARINFLQNNITVNLSQTPIRLRDDLQNIGVLTSQNLILLDNSRTLKIELYPKDSCGKYILRLIDKESDTLVQSTNYATLSVVWTHATRRIFSIILKMAITIQYQTHNGTQTKCVNNAK